MSFSLGAGPLGAGSLGAFPPGVALRAPRLRLALDGRPCPEVVAALVIDRASATASQFRVSVALTPRWEAVLGRAAGAIALDLTASLDGGLGWRPLASGLIDHVEIDAGRGLATLAGRDRACLLIAGRAEETFANQTAGEIAATLAARYGLSADVAPGGELVGRLWRQDRERLALDAFTRAGSAWDLLTGLAQDEGCELWVEGETLHFRPPGTPPPALVLRARAGAAGPANVSTLRLGRSLALVGRVEVVVKSWNARTGRSLLATAQSGEGGAPARYIYVIPNLTDDRAEALAARLLASLTRHQRTLIADLPGELALAPRMTVALDDGEVWRIEEIERRIGPDGFHERLVADAVEAG